MSEPAISTNPPRVAGGRTPLTPDASELGGLTVFERGLLDELRGDQEVFLVTRTSSRADTGLWFRRSKLWLACLGDRLLLFAYGAQPYSESHTYEELAGSIVNTITEELVLAHAGAMLPLRTVRLPLPVAFKVLALITGTEDS